jgi:ribosomal protein S18 acetylase RimI-like enzyme
VKTSLDLQQIKIIPLVENLSIHKFRCNVAEIDKWAKDKAQKFHSQNRTRIFCAVNGATNVLCGFYSMSFSSEDARKLNDRYREIYNTSGVPLVYIGYLAVSSNCQREGLGSFMLVDALRRAHLVAQHVAFYGVALRSLNERTTALYEKFGFGKRDNENFPLMILPIWTINDLFKTGN